MKIADLVNRSASSQAVLQSCLTYPRTDSQTDDLFAAVTITQDALDISAALQAIQGNPELIAHTVLADVQATLKVLCEVEKSAQLHVFDSVQLNFAGVNLLRIVNRSRDVNRSVHVDINDFRRRLVNTLMTTSKSPYALLGTWIVTGAVIVAATVQLMQYFHIGS